ncbi:hypothetical protein KJ632_01980, partial [Patescibacteria group bacterium]|nr:hypothetical protein [Patescibacteria group bacterium]
MGCKTKETKNGTLINGPKKLTPLRNIDLNHAPDLVMTFAILAIFCKGKTTIKNISNLKIKETDRIVALKNEISKLGIKVSISSSSITIHGDPKHNFPSKTITIKTYNDHRIAMCFGILQHAIPNLKIENPSCVKKSYPNFWNDLRKLQNKNIILTGMRGSGKTKLGKMLSKKIKKKFIDLDKEIEKLAKSKIKNIVKEKGWDHFRKLEKQISKNFSMQDNLIIATGGGTIINNENYQAFKQNSIIIYLHRLPANSLKYIANDKNRPNLTKEKDQLKDLEKTYKARKETYRQRADHTIKRTDDLEQDLGQILNLLNHPLS